MADVIQDPLDARPDAPNPQPPTAPAALPASGDPSGAVVDLSVYRRTRSPRSTSTAPTFGDVA